MLHALDISHALDYQELLPADSRSATAQGSAVDISAYAGFHMAVVFSCEAGTGTSPTNDLTFEESADGSTGWAAIPAAALVDPETGDAGTFDQVTDAGASFQVKALRKQLLKRYLRAVQTLGGTTPVFVSSVVLVAKKKYTDA